MYRKSIEQLILQESWRIEQYSSITYGVATISRIDKTTGLFCKRDLQKRRYSAKETYNFIDPIDRSHPIWNNLYDVTYIDR